VTTLSQADQDKWDGRYRDGAYGKRSHPSALLKEWLPTLAHPAPSPAAIDVACGLGRNAIYLARQGWRVDALDISPIALESLRAKATDSHLDITCQQVDLDHCRMDPALLGTRHYDLALLIRYSDLTLIKNLTTALKSGGYLLTEKHLITSVDVIGPRNPQFRVEPGALEQACEGLEILFYREGIVTDPDGRRAALAQAIGRKP
jgi:SAM-dependent methyltransferase